MKKDTENQVAAVAIYLPRDTIYYDVGQGEVVQIYEFSACQDGHSGVAVVFDDQRTKYFFNCAFSLLIKRL